MQYKKSLETLECFETFCTFKELFVDSKPVFYHLIISFARLVD